MNRMPFEAGNLLDLVRLKPDLVRKQRLGREPKSQTKRPSRRKAVAAEERYSVLVEKDQLFFRVVPWPRLPEKQTRAQIRKVEQAFIRIFNEVWQRLAPMDRQRLLVYWAAELTPDEFDRSSPPRYRPLIQVVHDLSPDDPASTWSKFGHKLSFPSFLVLDQPEHLTFVIARTLAMVVRLATRQHWGLILQMLEEPFAAWESEHKKDTEAASDKKWADLEKDYLRAYESELAEMLRRWGLVEA